MTDVLDIAPGGAGGLGIIALCVVAGWELARILLFGVFVLITYRAQRRHTGRCPTVGQAATALRQLLAGPRLLPGLVRHRPHGEPRE